MVRMEILKRWWYAFEDWPYPNYDYATELSQYKLRKVEAALFKSKPELDENGARKVYAVDGFPGVFRTSQVNIKSLF